MANYYYTFDKAGKPARHEGKPPVKYERTTDPEEIKKAEETYREIWNERRKPKPSPKPEKPTEAEKPTGGETVKTNATEGKNNGVYLNPDLLRRYALTEYGKDVTLFELISDPRHHKHEWEIIIYILTGKKEYKSEFDERFENFLDRIMD